VIVRVEGAPHAGAGGMNMEEIGVRILGRSPPQWQLVPAKCIGGNIYVVLVHETELTDYEELEFEAGNLVTAMTRPDSNGATINAAMRLYGPV